MIIRPRPRGWQLLYIMRGSIVPAIAPRVLAIVALATGVAAIAELWQPPGLERMSVAPFTLLGLVLSIFLSFRNSACYDRWWEARKQWGQLIVESRSLSRELAAMLPGDDALRGALLRSLVGFCHAFCARLRGQDARAAAAPWLDRAEALGTRANLPDAILADLGQRLAEPMREGRLSPYLYAVLEQRLVQISGIQAACERISNTPLPYAYTLLLHRSAWLFCVTLPFGLAHALGWATPVVSGVLAYAFFGLDRLGEEMEDPFGLEPNDLALDAMVRTIEIDLLDSLGVQPLPAPLQPVDHVLT